MHSVFGLVVGSNASSRASSRSSSCRPSLTRTDSENSISQLQNRKTKGQRDQYGKASCYSGMSGLAAIVV